MGATEPIVHEATIDGIPTLWIDTPPPRTISLWFRVGMWDESLLTRGVTHLLEHLALFPLHGTAHPYGGSTSGYYVNFHATGDDEELQRFFGTVSKGLRAVPTERLDLEASVLQAEGERRGRHWGNALLTEFFGPNGPGLLSYPERGLTCLRAEDIQAWADRYCVRDNAFLLSLGPPPKTLGLDLLEGPYNPYVLPPGDVGRRSSCFDVMSLQEGGACFGSLCERSTEASLGLQVLAKRLGDRLRHELGMVYEVSPSYTPLDRNTAYVFVGADAAQGRADLMAREFLAVIEALRREDPTAAELASTVERLHKEDETDERGRAHEAISAAFWPRFLQHDAWDPEAIRQEQLAATPAAVGAALRVLFESGSVVVPEAAMGDLPRCPFISDGQPEGRRFRPRFGQRGPVDLLVAGDDGVALRKEGRWVSLRWSELVFAGHDTSSDEWFLSDRRGASIWITPRAWRRSRALRKLLEHHVPRDVRLEERTVRDLSQVVATKHEASRREATARMVAEVRAQVKGRDALYDELRRRGLSDDEAYEAVDL